MEWHDDLARALPRPREDEPRDLRRRILAELRDHLHTAMQRELLLTGDTAQARHNVLARFGDPARIARKLWFDAMWEKIMMQRGMLVALGMLVLVSAASMGLTWRMVVQAGQVNRELLEQSRAMNESILARLQAMGNAAPEAAKSAEWNSLKLQFTWDTADGVPAEGIVVRLQGALFDGGAAAELVRISGQDGVADFGLIRTGQHRLQIETPRGESIDDAISGLLEFDGQLVTILPGAPRTLNIVCPSQPKETEISVAVDWPEKLAGRPLWLVCDFVEHSRQVGGHQWARSGRSPQFVVVDPAGKLMNPEMRRLEDGAPSGSRFFSAIGSLMREEETRLFIAQEKSFVEGPGIFRFEKPVDGPQWIGERASACLPYIWLPRTDAVSRFKWPAGSYSIAHLVVGGEPESRDESLPDELLHPQFLGGIDLTADFGHSSLIYASADQASTVRRKRREAKSDVYEFTAVPDRPNEWRISIPSQLVELLTEPVTADHFGAPPVLESETPNDAPPPLPYSE
ncbi:MAG TPA: hypothetical protein VHC22_20625 [Pirellulales bacterium]|nr:hypothetical protein [Pirellulales bacterium]